MKELKNYYFNSDAFVQTCMENDTPDLYKKDTDTTLGLMLSGVAAMVIGGSALALHGIYVAPQKFAKLKRENDIFANHIFEDDEM